MYLKEIDKYNMLVLDVTLPIQGTYIDLKREPYKKILDTLDTNIQQKTNAKGV